MTHQAHRNLDCRRQRGEHEPDRREVRITAEQHRRHRGDTTERIGEDEPDTRVHPHAQRGVDREERDEHPPWLAAR